MAEAAETTKTTKTKERSTPYPSMNLEEAIATTRELRSQLGAGPYSRDSAAVALGYKGINGASGLKIAACVHFGLLNKLANVYSQSELADQIILSTSDAETHKARLAALQSPSLYAKLLSEFMDKPLPAMLENILVRNYKVTEKAAPQVVKDFKQSAEFAGVLHNGVVTMSKTVSNPSEPQQVDDGAEEGKGTGQTNYAKSGEFPVKIRGTDITVLFPEEFVYDLGTGAFGKGLKQLADDAAALRVESDADKSVVTQESVDQD